jgi:hypothetical protein
MSSNKEPMTKQEFFDLMQALQPLRHDHLYNAIVQLALSAVPWARWLAETEGTASNLHDWMTEYEKWAEQEDREDALRREALNAEMLRLRQEVVPDRP